MTSVLRECFLYILWKRLERKREVEVNEFNLCSSCRQLTSMTESAPSDRRSAGAGSAQKQRRWPEMKHVPYVEQAWRRFKSCFSPCSPFYQPQLIGLWALGSRYFRDVFNGQRHVWNTRGGVALSASFLVTSRHSSSFLLEENRAGHCTASCEVCWKLIWLGTLMLYPLRRSYPHRH